MIDDALLLLVGAVMLLIDNDEAEICEREKESRARADNHLGASLGDIAPGAPSVGMADIGMPLDGRGTEARLEAREELGAERDLREQHDGLPSALERRRDSGEIDLGLARSGDAVEQRHAERIGPDLAGKQSCRRILVGGKV